MRAYDDNAKPFTPTEAVATMTGPQASVAKWPQFTLASDEPKSVGGTDTAPTPSMIFVASIGFAENVILARSAAVKNIDFDSVETKVVADWNKKGMFGIRGKDPSITALLIETRVVTRAKPEVVVELVRLNNTRCPMTTTVGKSAEISRRLFVNGTAVTV